MKYMKWALCALLIGAPLYGMAEVFTFVTTIASTEYPTASFREIETKDKLHTTNIPEKAALNAGYVTDNSNGSSGSGTINIQGNPIDVNTLSMEDDTSLSGGADKRWYVDTLKIHPNGTVVVGNLIAGMVTIDPALTDPYNVKLSATKVIINKKTHTKAADIKEELNAVWSGGKFHFQKGETSNNLATWKSIGTSENVITTATN